MIRHRIRKLITALVATLAITAAVAVTTELPALAASGGTCTQTSSGYLCLYQQKGYLADTAGDRWQTSLLNLDNSNPTETLGCITIGSAKWTNGTPITDNSAGMQFSHSATYDGFQIVLYNWTGCQTGGGAIAWTLTSGNRTGYGVPDLSAYVYPGTSISVYHTVTSVGLYCGSC